MSFTPALGRVGDFDFLAGEWRIANRRLLPTGQWDEFPGEASVHRLIGGVASVEELRIPARSFAGVGLRLFDVQAQRWHDFWINASRGVLSEPGMPGGFEGGVGTFQSEALDGDQPILMRGVWDAITPHSCRWQQGTSRDGGQTWDTNWLMHWHRA